MRFCWRADSALYSALLFFSAFLCKLHRTVPSAATWRAAQSCGLGKHKGRLRAGYDADLLLVDGNPLDDIGALRRVSAVILNGAIVGKSADIEEGPA